MKIVYARTRLGSRHVDRRSDQSRAELPGRNPAPHRELTEWHFPSLPAARITHLQLDFRSNRGTLPYLHHKRQLLTSRKTVLCPNLYLIILPSSG